jgi:hypothetical protein
MLPATLPTCLTSALKMEAVSVACTIHIEETQSIFVKNRKERLIVVDTRCGYNVWIQGVDTRCGYKVWIQRVDTRTILRWTLKGDWGGGVD